MEPLTPEQQAQTDVVIYRDDVREVVRRGPTTPGNAFADLAAHDVLYAIEARDQSLGVLESIHFQHDTIPRVGPVGTTNECLLAIVIDRLRCFQSSAFACDENKDALMLCMRALEVLEERTAKRKARGVEGTHTV